ncbi:bombesin receptor-activated protein C6orf89 homolog [Lytechinus variegatus]|uniref:bombesin receptor-activated protein C6orf89 homolog n=1 Tax=Lytechinus variegatus TaxID=7654 RepID=UPI001BB11BAC|nr:bombesin receptor-activated protein C6orf89 homolog [Lytechinus variegatus]
MAERQPRTRTQILKERVEEKINHFKDLASQQGLTGSDIDDCIILALKANKRQSKPASKLWRNLAQGTIIFSVILLCLWVVIINHKPTKQFFELLFFKTSYPVMRAVRLLSLPLARRVDLSYIYYSECALPNPLYHGATDFPDCYPCTVVSSIEVIEGASGYFSFGRPFMFKDPKVNQFTYGDMQTWHSKNQKIFSQTRADHVQSSNPFVHSTADLFTEERVEDDLEQSPFSFEWRVASAGSVRLVRNLCGKPSFIPSGSEVIPEMFLIIDSSSSYPHNMPKPSFPGYAWISQSHGSREIVLSPVPQCKNNCTDVSLLLEPGNVLFLDTRYWELQSFPFGDGGISVSCLGSFA